MLLAGQQAGRPVAHKNLRPLILQCFVAVGWVGERKGITLVKTHFSIHYYQEGISVRV